MKIDFANLQLQYRKYKDDIDANIQAVLNKSNFIMGEEVYDILLTSYTYSQCKQREINLGLDLKGGMNVTLEVMVIDVIKALSKNLSDLEVIQMGQGQRWSAREVVVCCVFASYNSFAVFSDSS